jgi:hypothetical protein
MICIRTLNNIHRKLSLSRSVVCVGPWINSEGRRSQIFCGCTGSSWENLEANFKYTKDEYWDLNIVVRS